MSRHLAAGLLLLWLGADAPARAESFDYLYLEANDGSASGGHVALRFGDDVYHYQYADDATLRLVREPFDFFRYAYTVFQNRTIHLSRIEVDPETYARLESRFNARHLIEDEQFASLDRRRHDVELLGRVQRRLEGRAAEQGAAQGPRLRGAGFFEGGAPGASPAPAAPLVALRARVEARHGPGFLAARRAEVEAALAGLEPEIPAPGPPPALDRLPASIDAFSQRFADLATARAAFEVLADARPLRREARRVVPGPEGELDAGERAVLSGLSVRLEGQLAELVASSRRDLGYPLLLGMARLLVLDASLRAGRLEVLDGFPGDARTLPSAPSGSGALFLGELRQYARLELEHTRRRVLSGAPPSERDYNDLEAAANRYLEVRSGIEQGSAVRVFRERLVPQGEWVAPDSWLPVLAPKALRQALETARQRERDLARELRGLYAYSLVTHNCVSALFDTINAAFEPGEVAERLGARVEAGGSLRFIPFVAFGSVTREYRISGVGEIPSYRRARLAEMYARENPVRVYLRETNTLTSSVYRRNPADSFFLFFTDDAVLPRPLFGALNLLAGLGQGLVGLVSWPLDAGRALRAGARGALFSLPELAFVNIRKGSLEYARSQLPLTSLELHPPDGGSPAAAAPPD